MMLTLHNFETVIDQTILQRGRRYYNNGSVFNLTKRADGSWTAKVSGSYDYGVEIEYDDEEKDELFTYCDCPYDWGQYCKHIVAVLYAIRDGGVNAIVETTVVKDNITTVIDNLTHEQLKEILLGIVWKDRELANDILLKYGTIPPDKSSYAEIMKNAIYAAQGRDGFIDYSSTHRAARPAWELIQRAETLVEEGQSTKAIPILQAVIETMTPVLYGGVDDSSGDISGTVASAFNTLYALAPDLDEPNRKDLLQYCFANIQNKLFNETWGDTNFDGIAAELVNSEEERKQLFDALEQRLARLEGERWSRYRQGRIIELMQYVMERLEDPPEVIHAFLLKNVRFDNIRSQLINAYIVQGKLKEATDLCVEGIEKAKQEGYPGLINQYREMLLRIAKKQGNTEQVIDLTRQLFFEGRNNLHLYGELKQHIPNEKWGDFVQELIEYAKGQLDYNRQELLGYIYIQEEMWSELLKMARQGGIRTLVQYKRYLHQRYPEECCKIYQDEVYRILQRTTGRDTYRQAASYLSTMVILGEIETVVEMIDDLKLRYANRRAMREELDKVL